MTSGAAPLMLPDEVRRDVLALAAEVLGGLDEADVPPGLRKVRDFAAARRASAGASPLAGALERDTVFRHRVGGAWRLAHPDLAEVLDDGDLAAAAEPALLLAGLHLLRPPGWQETSRTLLDQLDLRRAAALRQQEDAAREAAGRAVAAAAEQAQQRYVQAQAQVQALEEELAGLRREVRRARSDADRARAAARAAEQDAAAARAAADGGARAHGESVARLESEVRRLTDELALARRGEREGRSLADVRARLLLDTVLDAAAGLRRELALPPAGTSPADFVTGAAADRTDAGAHTVPTRAQAPDDPAVLERLLALPKVHLLVDGYNVTLAGYPTAPLAEQRRRLVDALALLAARTQNEVTCCFDGQEVAGSPAYRVRGVRVAFSDPGVSADELIRRLVRAEPPGRVVVVVSSDREVAAGVRAMGARAVPSAALLRLLARP